MRTSSIQDILNDFKAGQFVILVDDAGRENEGDLMLAAQYADAAKINFMTKEARGLVCLTLTEEQVDRLKLPLQKSPEHSSGAHHAAFTYSIEAAKGVGTGISARERAHTIQVAIRESALPADLVCPGHVFPLRARKGGVLTRPGHTEASVDLAGLCGLSPAGVICEILDAEGNAASGASLVAFSEKFNIRIGTVADLIHYRKSLS